MAQFSLFDEQAFSLDGLNAAQKKAAETIYGPLLVLAGAGSGKTRVLTMRIANMVINHGISPFSILAITFTNKAAKEMRDRLETQLELGTRGMWVCTFHSMCVRILRQHAERIGYSNNFTIYDADDMNRLVNEVARSLGIDTKETPVSAIKNMISLAKNELITAQDCTGCLRGEPFPRRQDESDDDYFERGNKAALDEAAARVYIELEERLKRAQAMDFDDLLLKTYELLRDNADVLAAYQDRFRFISVDEYQDTNHAQYKITELLARKHQNIMVVGDDDQSIYSWRGADISNILEFEEDYPEARVIKLEQNYRSTQHILDAANAVVARSKNRREKQLFTKAGAGEKIKVYQGQDERDEARWIAGQIEIRHRKGTPYQDIAVFYRTNAQSRTLEDMFLRAGVPYRMVGGTRFYDRAEIRDVMAYLKVIVNPSDDVSAKRVVNTPRRGVGATTIEKLELDARTCGLSFYEACAAVVARANGDEKLAATVFAGGLSDSRMLDLGSYPKKALQGLAQFVEIIRAGQSYRGDLREIVELVVDRAGIVEVYEHEASFEAQGRIENVQEFFAVAQEFQDNHAALQGEREQEKREELEAFMQAGAGELFKAVVGEVEPTDELGDKPADSAQHGAQVLADFMEWLALRTDLDALSGEQSAITMMTIHAAKGLEFPVVFVAGMEEFIFPLAGSMGDERELDEERRLAYVAITRARECLYLTHAQRRSLYGKTMNNQPSRFIRDIPEEHIERSGVGSEGFEGTGWAKRGDRRSTFGSGTGSQMYGGSLFGSSSSRAKQSVPQFDAGKVSEEFAPGDLVDHKVFGRGRVQSVKGDSLEIVFQKDGKVKKLMKGFAPIVKIVE